MTTRRGRCSTRTQLGENKRQAARRSRVTWAFLRRVVSASERDRGVQNEGLTSRDRSVILGRRGAKTKVRRSHEARLDDGDAKLGRSGHNSAKKN